MSDKIVSTSQAEALRSLSLPSSPFQRLADLLKDIPAGSNPIDLGVGEPKHAMPAFVGSVLAKNLKDFQRYPPIKGSIAFRQSVAGWLAKRFKLVDLIDPDRNILPLNGSREGLFFALFEACRRKPLEQPIVFSPNPFYQTYSAAANAAGCLFLAPPEFPDQKMQGLPNFSAIPKSQLESTVAVYIASPANPQGNCANLSYWNELLQLAVQYDFMVFADECYSEIYRDAPPTGILEAAQASGSLAHVISFNSLSKRSNLAGLRAGFMAGDENFMTSLLKFRSMAAPQVPLPVQAVAAAAFQDEDHVVKNRKLYNEKFAMAADVLSDVLPITIPDGGFFLWLDCSEFCDGEMLASHLWREAGLKVVPGSYLTAQQTWHSHDQINKDAGKIRIALVHDLKTTHLALKRLRQCLESSPRDFNAMASQSNQKADR